MSASRLIRTNTTENIMTEQQGQAGAERRHLGEREVHENDLAPHNVEPEIDQDSGEQQASNQRPQHDR